MARATFERGGVELRVVDPVSGVNVRGDRARLSQVVGNLLHNASKFTQAGDVVTVEIAQSAGRAEVRVSDTGSGISSQQLSSIFEPFAQAEQGLARTHGGLGLGLSLVRGLVEMHRGTVEASSPGPGRGAQFLVSLPLVEAAVAGRPRHSPRRRLAPSSSSTTTRTLPRCSPICSPWMGITSRSRWMAAPGSIWSGG